jgi:hypothetical protein
MYYLCFAGVFYYAVCEIQPANIASFWQLFVYSTAILQLFIRKIYCDKFYRLVFNAKEAASEYRFVDS